MPSARSTYVGISATKFVSPGIDVKLGEDSDSSELWILSNLLCKPAITSSTGLWNVDRSKAGTGFGVDTRRRDVPAREEERDRGVEVVVSAVEALRILQIILVKNYYFHS